MSKKETSELVSRRGKIAVAAGAAAALAVSGVAFASSASAANTVKLTLTAPTSVLNDGSSTAGSTNFSLEINNAGQPELDGALRIVVTKPAGLACENIDLAAVNTTSQGNVVQVGEPDFEFATQADGSCAAPIDPYTQDTNSDYKFNYTLSVQGGGTRGDANTPPTAGVTGALQFTAYVAQDLGNGNSQTTASNAATTQLTGLSALSAPTFTSTTPSLPVAFDTTYSFQLVTSKGVPTAGYRAFGSPTLADEDSGNYGQSVTLTDGSDLNGVPTADDTVTLPAPYDTDRGFDLDNGYYFDINTGKIVYASTNNAGTIVPPSSDTLDWTIIANNGIGGATTATNGNPGGGVNKPTPPLVQHDVVSPVFTSARGFKDVGITSVFSKAIYGLVGDNAIEGYLDGTFRPTASVSRQALAHFIFQEFFATANNSDGNCAPIINPSPFSDVSNSNQFCTAIQQLNNYGIINGYADGGFHPTATISRQAIAAVLYRVLQYFATGSTTGTDAVATSQKFKDVPTSNRFAGDINYLADQGIVKGYTDGGFHPTATVSRQATASTIYLTANPDERTTAARQGLAIRKAA